MKVLSETNSTLMPLIDIITRGKLIKPTNGMTELCRIAENVFRTQLIYKTVGATNIRKSFLKININKYFLNLYERSLNLQKKINNLLKCICFLIFNL